MNSMYLCIDQGWKDNYSACHHEESFEKLTHVSTTVRVISCTQVRNRQYDSFYQSKYPSTKKLYLQLEEVVSGFIIKL